MRLERVFSLLTVIKILRWFLSRRDFSVVLLERDSNVAGIWEAFDLRTIIIVSRIFFKNRSHFLALCVRV